MVDVDISIIFAGLSIGVSIVYYASVLQNANKAQQTQEETRQAQLFMNIYNQSFSSPTYQKAITKVFAANWGSFDDFKRMYHPAGARAGKDYDEELKIAYDLIGCFYEGVGVLVKEKLLDIRFVALLMTSQLRWYWEKTEPFMHEIRDNWNVPRWWIETEYLYNELEKYLEEHPELLT